mmetsp:Transcript_15526/g.32001  ORF Transcript_15526/g.32001 Transcript_15526/m.32001 type:complete len:496 (-) Transcript_15526:8-1495(-)
MTSNITSMAQARARSSVSPDFSSKPISSISDRTHKAHIKAEDLRKRRASFANPELFPPDEVAQLLIVPDSMKTYNRIARVFGVGCSHPRQSHWHIRLVALVICAANTAMFLVMNKAREEAQISMMIHLGMIVLQIGFFFSWRKARHGLNFDNTLLCRSRTIKLLEKAGRHDLAGRVDTKITTPFNKRFVVKGPLTFNLIIAPAIWLYIGKQSVCSALILQVSFAILQYIFALSNGHWMLVCRFNALQVELFHDELTVAFTDLAMATTRIEQRASFREISERENKEAELPRLSEQELLESTEFFNDEWVLRMTVQFVDICKTLHITSVHLGKSNAVYIFLQMGAAGLVGLSMLVLEVTTDKLVMVATLILISIDTIRHANVANDKLQKVRRLAWDCYGELMAHSLIFKGDEDLEAGSSLQYKQVINGAKHLLNIIQTSREGIKMSDDIEYSKILIIKIISISFSAAVVILRPLFNDLRESNDEDAPETPITTDNGT